ncbi:MAG: HD domain-containing protein [Sphingobacteriia bacterium]|nr:MAG: HD domain-containing protein [Sphingobacteriia bacterium]
MQWQFEREEVFLMDTIGAALVELGMDGYLIGGFVRDKIIGRPVKDMDIVCLGDGIVLAHAVARRLSPQPPVSFFKNFGTAQLQYKGWDLEFVGARKESYRLNSRNPAVEPGSLADDQNRRDFTMNALAIDLHPNRKGQLLDPFEGLKAIAEQRIQTPLAPGQTFSDDPLRMMRAIRFATQLGFKLHPETLAAIGENVHRIKIVSQERITDELNKIILADKPSVGFDLLFRTRLLHEIFPAMADLAGAEYIDGKGHKDNFYHTLQVLDNLVPNANGLWHRWAAILHDIGKPATKRFEEGHGWTFHGHEVVGAKMVPKIFQRLKLPRHEPQKYVQKLVLLHLRPISLTKDNITDSAVRRLLFDAGEDIDDLMHLCKADITSKNAQKVKRFLRHFELVQARMKIVEAADHLRNWQPPISGEEIMDCFGLTPGKQVGLLKEAIREAILEGVIPNEFAAAQAFMLEKAAEYNLKPVK